MKRQSDTPSIFAETLQTIEQRLSSRYAPTVDSNPVVNLEQLQILADMTKSKYEALLNETSFITLNDKDYKRLQTRIGSLIEANKNALEQHTLHSNSL